MHFRANKLNAPSGILVTDSEVISGAIRVFRHRGRVCVRSLDLYAGIAARETTRVCSVLRSDRSPGRQAQLFQATASSGADPTALRQRRRPVMTHAPLVHSEVFAKEKANSVCGTALYSPAILRLHSTLKCLSKCHIVISLIMFILAALADYVSYRVNTLRLHGLEECCAFYFLLMGITGIFGSASHRRGLIITFMLMGFHAVLIFAPIVIIVSSFDIHFYNRECWGQCDWHLLSASLPKNSKCQILCGENIDDNRRSTMSRLGTDYRLDAGLISLAILELLLSVVTTVLCCRQVFGLCSLGKSDISASNLELQPLHEKSSKSAGE
ncbi:Protein M60.6 [Aphelenchoides avenae]|nr:Protein M60.6 [Aphelenchus avenae]